MSDRILRDRRPDLAEEEVDEPVVRRRQKAPGKVTRTLSMPAGGGAAAVERKAASSAPFGPVDSVDAPSSDPIPDVFGGALDAPAEASAPAVAAGTGSDIAAAKAAIDRVFATQRDVIMQAAAMQGPALIGAAAAEHNLVLTAIGRRESAARGIFEHARGTIRIHEATQIGLARSEAAVIARRLREARAIRGAFHDAVDTEVARLTGTARMGGTVITVSGTGLFPRINNAAGLALSRANLDLRDSDGTAALTELDAAKESMREHVEDWIIADRVALMNGASTSGRVLNQSAHQIQAQATRPLVDASDEIDATGAMLAEAIAARAERQIEALATAERSVLAAIARNRRQVAGILQAGHLAGERLRQRAGADMTSLAGRQATAHQALDAAAAAGPEALAAARERQVAAAARAAQPVVDGLRAAPGALTAIIAERRDQLGAGIDQQLGVVSTQLAQVATGFAADCTAERGLAQQDYIASEPQLFDQAMSALAPAKTVWKAEADRFVVSVGEATLGVQAQHAQFASLLDDVFVDIARRAVAENRRSGVDRALGGATRGARGLVTGARNFGVGLGTLILINAAAPALGGLGIIAAGAHLTYGLIEGAKARVETLQSTWETRSTYEQVVGVVETIAVVGGDLFGVTPLLEGLMRHEAITHRPLSDEEAGVKVGEGAGLPLTLGIVKHVGGGKAGPAETPQKGLPPGTPPPLRPLPAAPKQLPAGEPAPSESRVADSAPTEPGAEPSVKEKVGGQAEPGTATAGARPGPKGCFVAGTKVWAANGARSIETLVAGDDVIATDIATGGRRLARAIAIEIRCVPTIVDLGIRGEITSCSEEHPFWIPGIGWRKAGALAPGTVLGSAEGDAVVESVHRRHGVFTVYNLRVDEVHTYHVSSLGLLVHNKGNVNEFFADRKQLVEQLTNDLADLKKIAADTTTTGQAGKADLSQRVDLAERIQKVERALGEARAVADELTINDAELLELPKKERSAASDEVAQLHADVAEAKKPFQQRMEELGDGHAKAEARRKAAAAKNDERLDAAKHAKTEAGGAKAELEAAEKAINEATGRRKQLTSVAERLASVERDAKVIVEHSASDSGIGAQKGKLAGAEAELARVEADLAVGHMFGSRGPLIRSKTMWLAEDGFERIDVENPNPGQRPGQIHYQPTKGVKWYYDHINDTLYKQKTGELAPRSVQERLADPEIRAAISEGLRQLGESR